MLSYAWFLRIWIHFAFQLVTPSSITNNFFFVKVISDGVCSFVRVFGNSSTSVSLKLDVSRIHRVFFCE